MRMTRIATVCGLVLFTAAQVAFVGWYAAVRATATETSVPAARQPVEQTCTWTWNNGGQYWDVVDWEFCRCPDGYWSSPPDYPGGANNEVAFMPCVNWVLKTPTPQKPHGGPVMETAPQQMPAVRE